MLKFTVQLALSLCLAISVAGEQANAVERLGSRVLAVAEVSLDGSLWKLDDENVDADGDPDFAADYRAENSDISIRVLEVKLDNPNGAAATLMERYVGALKERARTFRSLPCPDAYRPPDGWVCASYEMAITKAAPYSTTIVHLTAHRGHQVIKRIGIGFQATDLHKNDALAAFMSIGLRP